MLKVAIHYIISPLELVFRAATELDNYGALSYKLLQKVQGQGAYDGNPIYAILHEPCYCQG